MWAEVTELEKIGIAVALLLSKDDNSNKGTSKDGGFKERWWFKDLECICREKSGKRWHGRQFGNVKNCRREQDQKVGDYIHEFEKI